ncbi:MULTISPECIES: O-antigen ligase [Acidobacteriaceae]|uniref:O-antigen ligase family protein n=1 Tax=Acidobacteriaceae TaxID=204434 RepID=UPI00131E5E12|nr:MULTISPECIES: O-antigen ligase family protein [Acidobacteriaceae]MDW5265171.1 O-antigen ligase family protein [Edaphobacter sp.]
MNAENVTYVEVNGIAFTVGFFFSFRLSVVLLSVRLLGVEPSTGAALSLGLDLLLLGLVCFGALGATHSTFRSMLRLSSIRWVLVFLTLSCSSLVWSETASVTDSTAYWFGLVADVAIVVLLLRSDSTTSVSHSLMKGFIWSTCCLAIVAWIMPIQSDLRLGDEQFFNTNQIGNLCAFAVFLAQYLMSRKDGKWRVVILFLVITLFRSLSKTTIVAFLMSESYLIIADKAISRKTKILLMASAGLLILAFWGLFEAYYDIYTTAGTQAETLTGRTAIWLYVLNAVFDHPWNLWIGHGFDSWWKVVPPFGDQFEARHAENELLQQFYAYGVIGVCMLIGVYGSLWRQIRLLPRSSVKVMFFSILLYIVVRGIAVAEPFDLLLPLWAIVLMSALINCEGARAKGNEAIFF